MYENITYEDILRRMLDRIPDDMDKREGSIIYDALAPAAIEMQNMYIELDNTLNETFADTASREYLVKRCAEAGIIPKPSTHAVIQGGFTPNNTKIPIGSRFSVTGGANQLNYKVVSKEADGRYNLECEKDGSIGNVYTGGLIPVDYIEGLETANISALLVTGADEENTESLRKRYFQRLSVKPFGGNIADYKERVNSIPGVGGVKVFRRNAYNNTPGYVTLIILASNFKAPTVDTVSKVQNLIDPDEGKGEGVGLAPIGHWVMVSGVSREVITISADITYQSGWSWADVEETYNATIDKYYEDLARTWQDNDTLLVRIGQLEVKLLEVPGIRDIRINTINGVNSNYEVKYDSIPVRVLTEIGGGGLG